MEEAKLSTMKDFYLRAVKLISQITGKSMFSSQTIREYLGAVGDSLGRSVYRVFERLSLLYERWLYGVPVKPNLKLIRRLLSKFKDVLALED